MKQLSIDNKLSLQGFWKLKKNYSTKNTVGSSVITANGVEVFGEDAIINEYRQEFIKRLSPSEIDVEYKAFEKRTVQLSKMCIELSSGVISPEFSMIELNKVIKRLKSGITGPTFPNEIFIHGGNELKEFFVGVVNKIKNQQVIPAQWMKIQITTIYKRKGSLKKLVNQRGIFLTSVICKVFERLIMGRIDEYINNISMWQAGSRKNRSTTDQTFLLRGAINRSTYLNKPLFLTFYDFRQCFDKMWLQDALLSLWNLGIKDDMLKLISILNEYSEAVVKTPLGKTESFVLGPNAKQGTVLGPILSSSSVAECCYEIQNGGAAVGSLVLRALAFVDDLAGLNHVISDVHESHESVTHFSKKKRLPLNEDKCYILPVNVPVSMAVPVLVVNNREIDACDKMKYLGDIFNTKGNNDDMIEERVATGLKCMINTLALASEVTLGIHMMMTVIVLYKIMFIPVVTFNSGAWNNITATQINKLRSIQLKFLKRIVHAPSSTANCITFLELGILPIEHNIHKSQLQFLHHILTPCKTYVKL